VKSFGVGAVLTMLTAAAHAAGIDITAVTSGITDAQAAIIAVITALLAMSTAIFGLAKVYAFVKRRAGA